MAPDKNSLRERLLPTALLARLRAAELRPGGLVDGKQAGRFRSPQLGVSVEFAGHREYAFGDDAKHFDWPVYYRTHRSYVRQYEQETNFDARVLLDVSESMLYPLEPGSDWRMTDALALAAAQTATGEVDRALATSAAPSKLLAAARLATTLTWMLTRRRDAVSFACVGAASPGEIAASPGPAQVERVLDVLARTEPRVLGADEEPGDQGSELLNALKAESRTAAKRERLFIISDMVGQGSDLLPALRKLSLARHQVVLLHMLHPDERELPFEEPTLFEGYEGSGSVETEPAEMRVAYREAFDEWTSELRSMAHAGGAEYWQVDVSEGLEAFFVRFLTGRARS